MKNGHLNICLKQSEDFLSVRKGLRDIKSQVLRTGLAIQDFQSIELARIGFKQYRRTWRYTLQPFGRTINLGAL